MCSRAMPRDGNIFGKPSSGTGLQHLQTQCLTSFDCHLCSPEIAEWEHNADELAIEPRHQALPVPEEEDEEEL